MTSSLALHTQAQPHLVSATRDASWCFRCISAVGKASARLLSSLSLGGVCAVATMTPHSVYADSKFDPANAQVYSWGSSQYYQTGHGHAKNISVPKEVEQLRGVRPAKIACGGQQSMCVTDNGQLYTFGRGEDYRLGHGANTPESHPRLVTKLQNERVVAISAGEKHMGAVTEKGELYTWGNASGFQLGHKRSDFPEKVDLDTKIVGVACGSVHTLALAEDGRVFAAGKGRSGCLGFSNRQDRRKFEVIAALKNEKIVQVAAGEDFSIFLSESGKLFSCGATDFGQAGQGQASRYVTQPQEILGLGDEKIVAIATGALHAAAVTASGELYTWGENKRYQLGHGDNHFRTTPHKVTALEGVRCLDVACGWHHTAIIAEGNEVYVMGDGRSGQLGRGDHNESQAGYHTTPAKLTFFDPLNIAVRRVALGSDHSVAIVAQR